MNTFMSAPIKCLKYSTRGLVTTWAGLLHQVRAMGPPLDNDASVAAHLLRLRDPATGERLSDALLAGEFGMFFTAGLETSGNAISWTLCVSPYPHPCSSLPHHAIACPASKRACKVCCMPQLLHCNGAGTSFRSIQGWRPSWRQSWTRRACWSRASGQSREDWSTQTWDASPTCPGSARWGQILKCPMRVCQGH